MVEIPTHLTNDDLLAATTRLAADERTTVAALVAHLAEIDARRLAVAAGYSLFTYCREVLLLSEDAACTRTTAVRMVRAFPSVLPMLADGRLNLSTLRVLAPHLAPGNHAELIAEAAGQSKRRVEELVARRFPQVVTTSIRRMAQPRTASRPESGPQPTTAAGQPDSGTPDLVSAGATEVSKPAGAAEPERAAPGAPRAIPRPAERHGDDVPPPAPAPRAPLAGKRAVTPMAEDVFLIRLAANRAMVGRLHRAQDLLAHAVPRGDVSEVFDRALMALIENLEKQKFARRPRAMARGEQSGAQAATTRQDHTRTITAEVRRAVSVRDQERCAYVSPFGRRCDATAYLEFHHLRPYEVGGEETVDNIALRCQAHNKYEAEVYFAPIREAMTARDSMGAGMSAPDSIRPGTDDRASGAPQPASP